VLAVDDNPLNQEVLRELLTEAGLDTRQADNGADALRIASEDAALDLVLMDGLEETRRIREFSACAALPIIALTANVQARDRARCLKAGMNDFLTKPADLPEFTRVLLRWLPPPDPSLRQTAQPAGATRSPAPLCDGLRAIAQLEIEVGLRSTRDNVDAYRRLLERFVAVHREDVDRLRQPLSADQPYAIAHSLKATAGAIGTLALAACADRLAPESARGETRDAAAAALADALLPVLRSPPVRHAQAAVLDDAADGSVRESLKASLAQRDMSAMRYAREHRGAIRATFGPLADELLRHIDGFEFEAALSVLARDVPQRDYFALEEL